MEAMKQFGFIVLFSNTFPLAPLFSFISNLVEIRVKLDTMTNFGRRFVPEGDDGIGAWLEIMDFLSMICIPVNCAIMYFTGQNSWQDQHESEDDYTSSIKSYLIGRDTAFWNQTNIILLVVMIEHVLLLFKYALKEAISDVPASVELEDARRPKVEKRAREHIKKKRFEDDELFGSYEEHVKEANKIRFNAKKVVEEENDERVAFKILVGKVHEENAIRQR